MTVSKWNSTQGYVNNDKAFRMTVFCCPESVTPGTRASVAPVEDAGASIGEGSDTDTPPGEAVTTHLEVARRLYRERRSRAPLFGAFTLSIAEPEWDILLTVFIASRQGQAVTVSAVCQGAAAPASTALRTVYLLERKKVLRLERDKTDRRRSYVLLSDKATMAMMAYLDLIRGSGER